MPDPFERFRGFEYISEYAFSLALFLFSSAAGCVRRAAQWIRGTRAHQWSTTPGTITTADVAVVHGKVNDYAVGRVGYSYSVDGNYYAGYFTRQFHDEQRAWTFVDSCKNSQVLIRYKPDTPDVSVLRPSDQQVWPAELPFDLWAWIPVKLRGGKRHWPTSEGVVESAGARRLGSDEGGGLVHELVFSYSVNGTYYSGVFRYSHKNADVEDWVGQKILIHYLPEDPSKSVLFIDEQHQAGRLNVE